MEEYAQKLMAGEPDAYDNLLWKVVTATADELARFAEKLCDQPYIDLPPPIQVAILRLLGNERRDNTGWCINMIAMYCSSTEQEGATMHLKTLR